LWSHRAGFPDGTDNQSSQAGRLQLRVDPNEDLDLFLGGDYYHAGG